MPDNPRIDVRQQNTNIVMTDRTYPEPIAGQKVLEAEESFHVDKNVKLLFTPDVTAHLFEEISWNSRANTNASEKAGLLVGKYYKSTSRGKSVVWGEVTAIIPFDDNLVKATRSSITITTQAWTRMLNEYVPFKNEGYLMLGWYHTHLGAMPPRFSGLDKVNQQNYFTGEYSFAVILNPNQKKWAVAYGPEAKECYGDLFVTEETLTRYADPKITINGVSGDAEQTQDGRIVHRNPNRSTGSQHSSTSRKSSSITSSFGNWLERVGKRLNSNNEESSGITDSGNSTDIRRTPTREQTAPRITVQETAKPKITILPKAEADNACPKVKASVAIIPSDDLSKWNIQSQDGLQIIDSNITQLVKSILAENEASTASLTNPIKANVKENNDLTLEFSLNNENNNNNAVIRLSKQSIKDSFTEALIKQHIESAAAKLDNDKSDTMYLTYIGSTTKRIEVMVFKIERSESNE